MGAVAYLVAGPLSHAAPLTPSPPRDALRALRNACLNCEYTTVANAATRRTGTRTALSTQQSP